MVGWNVASLGDTCSRDGKRIFSEEKGEVERLKRFLQKARLEGVDDWVQKIVQEGDLDASFATMVMVVSSRQGIHQGQNNAGVTKRSGLRKLRVKLDHTAWRGQPE